ncbi:MAG: EAL domain-containing protein [Candidatus Thiodiazotropha sp.]
MTRKKDSGVDATPGKRPDSHRKNQNREPAPSPAIQHPTAPKADDSRSVRGPRESKGFDVLLLQGELGIWEQVVQAISAKGWTYHCLTRFPALQAALADDVKAILVDAAFLPELDRQPRWLHVLEPARPALFILSAHCDIRTRIQALQTGAERLFLEPIDLKMVMQAIEARIQPQPEPGLRVLIVADDDATAAPAAEILKPRAADTLILTDHLAIIDAIWRFRPDLILIMEPCSADVDGRTLTKLIREREESAAIPIIFLNHDHSPEKALQALQAGADDALSLSMYPHWLSSVVSCRVARSKAISTAGIHTLEGQPAQLPGRGAMRRRIEQAAGECVQSGCRHALIVIDLALPQETEPNGMEGETNRLIALVNEGLGPILQAKDFIARIATRRLAVLVRREHDQALRQLAELAAEILNYRVSPPQLPANAFGIGLVLLEQLGENAEALLTRSEREAETDRRCKQTDDANGTGQRPPPDLGVKEGSGWFRDEFMHAIEAGTMALRERRFVSTKTTRHQIETIELAPGFDYPGSPVDIYQQAALCGASREFDRVICRLGIERLYEYITQGKWVRLIIRQSPGVLESGDYIASIKSTLRRHQIVGNGLVLEFALPALASRLRQATELFDEVAKLGIGISLSHFPCNESGFKALAHLKADIVRPRPSCLQGATTHIQEIAGRIHSRQVDIVLPDRGLRDAISPQWRTYADYIPDQSPRLELLQGEIRGEMPSDRGDRRNPFLIV